MKKFKKLLVVLLAIAALAACSVCFVACGDKDSSVVGTWKFVSMTQTYVSNGQTQTKEIKAGETYEGMDITEDYMVMEFKEDGTFTQTMTVGTYTNTHSGTWKQDEKTVTITMESENTNGTVDGDKLTFVSNQDVGAEESVSMTLVLKKA